jgi:hypothetical protein
MRHPSALPATVQSKIVLLQETLRKVLVSVLAFNHTTPLCWAWHGIADECCSLSVESRIGGLRFSDGRAEHCCSSVWRSKKLPMPWCFRLLGEFFLLAALSISAQAKAEDCATPKLENTVPMEAIGDSGEVAVPIALTASPRNSCSTPAV